VLITAEEHLAGALDLKVIAAMLKQYDPQTTDIIVLGSHGAFVLANRRVKLRYFFRMVDPGHTADLRNVMDLILPYKQVKVFFKSYQSLGKQTVAALDLLQTVLPLLEQAKGEGLISPRNYTFEPSAEEIAGFMEDVMIENALGQTVLQSQLAQLANRFILMIAAHQRSKELRQKLQHQFYRSKRQLSDERMRETMLAARLHA
jgi:F0F1-type ATP synthase gamma subunit